MFDGEKRKKRKKNIKDRSMNPDWSRCNPNGFCVSSFLLHNIGVCLLITPIYLSPHKTAAGDGARDDVLTISDNGGMKIR